MNQKPFLYEPSGDVIIGGLFPVHESGSMPFECSDRISESGILMLEAFLWALKTMNKNSQVLKGMKLGAFVPDTCGTPGETFETLKSVFSKPGFYQKKNSSSVLNWKSIIGFVNAPDNEPAITAANILGAYNITNVGPHSPTEVLGNKWQFPYSLRTSVPIDMQIKGLIQMLKKLHFTYASVVYSSSRQGQAELKRLMAETMSERICLAISESMPSNFESVKFEAELDRLVLRLKSKKMQGARAVILLLSDPGEINQFLQALNRAEKNGLINPGEFLLFSTVEFGDNPNVANNIEETSLGAITMQYDVEILGPFKRFLKSLRFDNNDVNPWWKAYWKQKFDCNTPTDCSQFDLDIDSLHLSSVLTNVINSVWSMAVGLANLHKDICRTELGFCMRLKNQVDLHSMVFNKVETVAFNRADKQGETFHFGMQGYPDMKLRLINIVRKDDGLTFQKIGTVHNGNLSLSAVPVAYVNGRTVQMQQFKSECSNISICFECKILADLVTKSLKLPPSNSLNKQVTSAFPTTTIESTSTSSVLPVNNLFTIPAMTKPTPILQESVYKDQFKYLGHSEDGYLVSIVLPIHEKGSQPFSCGKIRKDAYQNLEAMTWALNQINTDSTVLPGTKLKAIILDSCSQPSRGVRDLSNFLSEQVKFQASNRLFVDPTEAIGVLTPWGNEEALALSRVASQFGIPAVSPGAEAEVKESGFKNNLLRTSISSRDQGTAVVALLRRLQWDSVAVLYTNDIMGIHGKEHFESVARENNICIALDYSLPIVDCDEDVLSYDRIIARLIALRQAGVYGVVLWVSPNDFKCLLASVKRATRSGSLKRGDLVLILPILSEDLDEIVTGEESNAVGMISLKAQAAPVTGFNHYWKNIRATPEDQWRLNFFENTFDCHGINCISSKYSLSSVEYKENPYLLNSVNALLSVAYGIENVRKTLCGAESIGLCDRMKTHPNIRKVVTAAVRTVTFKDYSGKVFRYTLKSFSNSGIEIQNLQRNINGFEYRIIGTYNLTNDLVMWRSPKGFENGLQSFNLRDRASSCMDYAVCPVCQKYESPVGFTSEEIIETTTKFLRSSPEKSALPSKLSVSHREPVLSLNQNSGTKRAQLQMDSQRAIKDSVIIPSSKQFSLAGIFPLHKSADLVGLTCGDFNPSSGFQQLAAFFYALGEVNKDPHILPGVELGAVIFDSCSSDERATANFFEIFASETSGVSTSDIVSTIGLNSENAVNMSPLMKSLDLSLIQTAPAPLSLKADDAVMGTVPAEDAHIRILADTLYQMDWTYVSILFEDSDAFTPGAKYMETLLKSREICVATAQNISSDSGLEAMQLAVRKLVMKSGARAVVLFLSNSKMYMLMEALAVERVSTARFIFVTTFNEDWTFDVDFLTLLSQFDQGLLTVEVQRFNNTMFFEYLNRLTPQQHQPFPDDWFYEYWQDTFKCYIPGADRSMVGTFANPCTGAEKLNASSFQQSPSILPTVLAVQTAARGLHKFVQNNCPGRSVNSLSECLASNPRPQLIKAMKSVNFSYAYSPDKDPVWVNFDTEGFMNVEYSIRNMIRRSDGNYQYMEVGVWRPDTGLLLDTNQIKVLNSHEEIEIPSSRCPTDICAECPNVTVIQGNTHK